jgi:hypothetical protein
MRLDDDIDFSEVDWEKLAGLMRREAGACPGGKARRGNRRRARLRSSRPQPRLAPAIDCANPARMKRPAMIG